MTRRDLFPTAALAALPASSAAQTVTPAQSASPGFKLPPLPYALDALEPFIDARTMEIHHGKHHQAYVTNLNQALAGHPSLAGRPVENLLAGFTQLPESIQVAVRNSGGGHANHSLLWQSLGKPSGGPRGTLHAAIEKSFGGQSAFEDKLRAAGLAVFGSGWVWVTPDSQNSLVIQTAPNQENPWMKGKTPLFGIDVWEHAYYLQYQNRRAGYLTAVFKVVNWDFLTERYANIVK